MADFFQRFAGLKDCHNRLRQLLYQRVPTDAEERDAETTHVSDTSSEEPQTSTPIQSGAPALQTEGDILPVPTEQWIRYEDIEFHSIVDKKEFEANDHIIK